jgi:hypothetical protein
MAFAAEAACAICNAINATLPSILLLQDYARSTSSSRLARPCTTAVLNCTVYLLSIVIKKQNNKCNTDLFWVSLLSPSWRGYLSILHSDVIGSDLNPVMNSHSYFDRVCFLVFLVSYRRTIIWLDSVVPLPVCVCDGSHFIFWHQRIICTLYSSHFHLSSINHFVITKLSLLLLQ